VRPEILVAGIDIQTYSFMNEFDAAKVAIDSLKFGKKLISG
jgi:hypothetical protein